MADYYGKTRTNYFSVTDAEKFKQIIASCGSTDEIKIFDEKQNDGSVKYMFYCEGIIQGLPEREKSGDDDNREDCEDDDFDYDYNAFCESLQKIIPDNDAIIITEIGSEKMRYLTGISTVITNKDFKCIDISRESVKLAAKMLNNPEFTTQIEY